MISRRREERTTVSAPIRIWGMDANGKPFSVPATTHDITRFGVRVMGIRVPLTPGEIVGVQHGAEKARFRVAWCGRTGSRMEGNIGLQALDWKKHIWGSLVQDSVPSLVNAGSEPINTGEGRYSSGIDPLLEHPAANIEPLSTLERRPSPAMPPTPAPPSRSAIARLVAAERRLATRYNCNAAAQIIDPTTGEPSQGTLREMSLVGCFIETRATFAYRAPIRITIRPFAIEFTCNAQVRHIEQGVGFGIKFTQLTEAAHETLEAIIERLASEGSAGSTHVAQGTKGAESRAQQMSAAVDKLTMQLREVESLATRNGNLDPQLLRALRTHSEQARQAAFAAQQWLEFQDAHKDTAPLLAEAENRRLRASISLLRELLNASEAESFTVDRPAVAELYAAAVAIYRRLAWLAERRHPTSAEKH